LITFDLIYPTFTFYLYYLFFKKLDKWECTFQRRVMCIKLDIYIIIIRAWICFCYHDQAE